MVWWGLAPSTRRRQRHRRGQPGQDEVEEGIGLGVFQRCHRPVSRDHVGGDADRVVLVEHGVGARDGEFGNPDGLDRVAEVDHSNERTVTNQDVLVVQIVVDHLAGKRSKVDRVVPGEHALDQPPSAWIFDRIHTFPDDPPRIREVPEEVDRVRSRREVGERVHDRPCRDTDLVRKLRWSTGIAVGDAIDP